MKGIYKITNPIGMIYIGKSINIKKRWGKYYNFQCEDQPILYSSLINYGIANHTFEIQEEYFGNSNNELSLLEKKWYQYYVENNMMLNAIKPNVVIDLTPEIMINRLAKIKAYIDMRKLIPRLNTKQLALALTTLRDSDILTFKISDDNIIIDWGL
jgi:group I intron endonuclease